MEEGHAPSGLAGGAGGKSRHAPAIRLLYCLFLLVPLVVLPLLLFLVSTGLGIAGVVVSLILGIPLLIATYAHIDLLLAQSRYQFSVDELDEFSRLVPSLARKPEFAAMRPRERTLSTKRAAEQIIRRRRAG